ASGIGTSSRLVGALSALSVLSALSALCAVSVKATGGVAISPLVAQDNGAPHSEHCLTDKTLIDPHREHRVRFSGDPHLVQNVDPSGLTWAQKLQARRDICMTVTSDSTNLRHRR